jgi:hypothetical protein
MQGRKGVYEQRECVSSVYMDMRRRLRKSMEIIFSFTHHTKFTCILKAESHDLHKLKRESSKFYWDCFLLLLATIAFIESWQKEKK